MVTVTYSEGLKMFDFSLRSRRLVTQVIANLAASLADNLRHLRAVLVILVWKEEFDEAWPISFSLACDHAPLYLYYSCLLSGYLS